MDEFDKLKPIPTLPVNRPHTAFLEDDTYVYTKDMTKEYVKMRYYAIRRKSARLFDQRMAALRNGFQVEENRKKRKRK